jgi:hypothetical protein
LKALDAAATGNIEKTRVFQCAERRTQRCVHSIAWERESTVFAVSRSI